MCKRIALTLAFLATFALVGFSFPSNAEAWRSWGRRPYAAYYYGRPHAYYGYYGRPYATYYYPPVYRSYYYGAPYAPGYYGYYGGPGISVSVGF